MDWEGSITVLLLKPSCKNFEDDFKNVIDQTDRPKVTDASGSGYLRYRDTICYVKPGEIKISIIKNLKNIYEILSENRLEMLIESHVKTIWTRCFVSNFTSVNLSI